MRIITRKACFRLGALALLLFLGLLLGWLLMLRMPSESFQGDPPALTGEETALRDALRADVEALAGEIGERNVDFEPEALAAAARHLEAALAGAGYEVEIQSFPVKGVPCENLIATLPGRTKPGEIVAVGGHYDSVIGCPGANDNATGAAATLALARRFAGRPLDRTVRFCLFVNEEPPWFQTKDMGSLRYAKLCRERGGDGGAMISLETMGFFTDEPKSQEYPFPLSLFYPSTGNFIGFVGNYGSRDLVRRAIRVFREHATIPSEGGAPPGFVAGVGWSDHWAFWQAGYPAIMVTDTAPFRYEHYHRETDTPDRVDYEGLTRVVSGLVPVVEDLATR
jgi:hypothetical protein